MQTHSIPTERTSLLTIPNIFIKGLEKSKKIASCAAQCLANLAKTTSAIHTQILFKAKEWFYPSLPLPLFLKIVNEEFTSVLLTAGISIGSLFFKKETSILTDILVAHVSASVTLLIDDPILPKVAKRTGTIAGLNYVGYGSLGHIAAFIFCCFKFAQRGQESGLLFDTYPERLQNALHAFYKDTYIRHGAAALSREATPSNTFGTLVRDPSQMRRFLDLKPVQEALGEEMVNFLSLLSGLPEFLRNKIMSSLLFYEIEVKEALNAYFDAQENEERRIESNILLQNIFMILMKEILPDPYLEAIWDQGFLSFLKAAVQEPSSDAAWAPFKKEIEEKILRIQAMYQIQADDFEYAPLKKNQLENARSWIQGKGVFYFLENLTTDKLFLHEMMLDLVSNPNWQEGINQQRLTENLERYKKTYFPSEKKDKDPLINSLIAPYSNLSCLPQRDLLAEARQNFPGQDQKALLLGYLLKQYTPFEVLKLLGFPRFLQEEELQTLKDIINTPGTTTDDIRRKLESLIARGIGL